MKSPGIIKGVIIAFLISLAAGIANLLFGGIVADATLFSLILCASTLAYLIYLLKHSSARVGRIVVISGWAVTSVACWLFDLPLFEQVFIQAGIIWLVRSLYFHTSIFAALLDFGLVSVGLAASAWAIVNTGSPATAIWSFFLIQSLFGWIPDLAKTQSGDAYSPRPGQAPFQSAHRVAVDAVRKLTQP
jgi:hypothetical protein